MATVSKRAFDFACALLFLVLLSPVLLVVAIAVAVSTRGPVFFRQQRVGRGGDLFKIYKFRTMRAHAESHLALDLALYETYVANGYKIPTKEDPRVTRLGAVLRNLSVDELPQLINVLRGDMTLVGPRPVVPAELARYGEYTDLYLSAKPGMTGAWQTGGRSKVDYPERAKIDADYVAGWTFWSDIKILLLTIPAVVRRDGAH